MTAEKNIKRSNRYKLIVYLFVNILIFYFFAKNITFDITRLNSLATEIFNPKNIWIFIFYVFSIIFEGVLSPNIKARLIFGKTKNPLPGSRAFSDIAKKDQRIDMNLLNKLFSGNPPVVASKQNAEWYKLYRRYSSCGNVYEAHRVFLLTRDLASLTIILIPISICGHIILNTNITKTVIHMLILLLLLLGCLISSRNYGDRFVANVIVEAIQEQGSKKT